MSDDRQDDVEAGIAALLTSVLQLQLAERRIESRIAADLGLSQSDILALALLVREQHRTIGRIAVDLDLTPGSASTLVTRLTKAGLVERVPSPVDGRIVLIEVTQRGTAAVRQVRDEYADAIRSAAQAVTGRCVATAADVVSRTAHHLAERERGRSAVS